MIRALLHVFGLCLHHHDRRDRRDGKLVLVCECGHVVPLIARTQAERKAMRRDFPEPKQARAQGTVKVVEMKGRR